MQRAALAGTCCVFAIEHVQKAGTKYIRGLGCPSSTEGREQQHRERWGAPAPPRVCQPCNPPHNPTANISHRWPGWSWQYMLCGMLTTIKTCQVHLGERGEPSPNTHANTPTCHQLTRAVTAAHPALTSSQKEKIPHACDTRVPSNLFTPFPQRPEVQVPLLHQSKVGMGQELLHSPYLWEVLRKIYPRSSGNDQVNCFEEGCVPCSPAGHPEA